MPVHIRKGVGVWEYEYVVRLKGIKQRCVVEVSAGEVAITPAERKAIVAIDGELFTEYIFEGPKPKTDKSPGPCGRGVSGFTPTIRDAKQR